MSFYSMKVGNHGQLYGSLRSSDWMTELHIAVQVPAYDSGAVWHKHVLTTPEFDITFQLKKPDTPHPSKRSWAQDMGLRKPRG